MRRLVRFTILFLFLASIISPMQPAVAASTVRPAVKTLNSDMQRVVDLINLRRREAGIHPVTVHPVLMACAQQYSEVQASIGAISHTGPDGSNPGQRLTRCGYRWKAYGENLAAGYVNPDELVAAWMASPGHRRNILNPKVREIGLGYTHKANDPSFYYDYYVMEVGLRR